MVTVRICGAGPAGSSAALAALDAGAAVEIYEKSPFPRHKVCGEFLSPETSALLARLNLTGVIERLQPARLRTMSLHFASYVRTAPFPEPAYGLSRFALDQVLLDEALRRGAVLRRETASRGDVIATGRKAAAPRGRRLFGFKAHFSGPVSDALELYFLPGYSYVGVSAVENGITNVCGLAAESELRPLNFDIDAYLHRHVPLRLRLSPLTRTMNWLHVGPLVFSNKLSHPAPASYPAGDELSFVDPFTGSGILAAILTGTLAGRAATLRLSPSEYLRECRYRLQPAFRAAVLFRSALRQGWGIPLARFLPPAALFQITRPRV